MKDKRKITKNNFEEKEQKRNIKTRRPSVLTFSLFLVLIIVSCVLVIIETKNKLSVPTVSEDTVIGSAESDVTTIQFKDVNMYNAVKQNIGTSKIQSFNDTNMTIIMTNANIESVKYLRVFSYAVINDISGIEKFTYLKDLEIGGYGYLDAENMINDLIPLSSLTNLTSLR